MWFLRVVLCVCFVVDRVTEDLSKLCVVKCVDVCYLSVVRVSVYVNMSQCIA